MFEVVVFLACRRAEPEGPRGPGATLRLPYTLEGVSYTYRFDDPATEPARNIVLPRRGRYELRLMTRRRRSTWRGEWWRLAGSHYIAVE